MAKKEEKKLTTPTTQFEVDGQKYQFVLPKFKVKVHGEIKEMTAQEALKDAEVLAHLAEIRSGLIKKVTETKETAE